MQALTKFQLDCIPFKSALTLAFSTALSTISSPTTFSTADDEGLTTKETSISETLQSVKNPLLPLRAMQSPMVPVPQHISAVIVEVLQELVFKDSNARILG